MTALVLTAHGSADPRSAANARAIARLVRRRRPGLDVRVAFCEQNSPRLVDVLTPGAVVTPLLLADAYHARVDIPRQIAYAGIAGVRQAGVLGEDDRLISVLRERLSSIGVCQSSRDLGVLVVAIGSTDAGANAGTTRVATKLAADTRWAGATTAFPTGSGPSLREAAGELRRRGAHRMVIAPWFLAPGQVLDRVRHFARDTGIAMAAPLGAHRMVADTVLDRFEQAVYDDRMAA